MTIDDIKDLAAKGWTHVSFPVEREGGKILPMGEAEQSLINAGALWYQSRDDEKRTYLILSKSRALEGASE